MEGFHLTGYRNKSAGIVPSGALLKATLIAASVAEQISTTCPEGADTPKIQTHEQSFGMGKQRRVGRGHGRKRLIHLEGRLGGRVRSERLTSLVSASFFAPFYMFLTPYWPLGDSVQHPRLLTELGGSASSRTAKQPGLVCEGWSVDQDGGCAPMVLPTTVSSNIRH